MLVGVGLDQAPRVPMRLKSMSMPPRPQSWPRVMLPITGSGWSRPQPNGRPCRLASNARRTLPVSTTPAPRQLQALQHAARARGVELSIYRVAKPDEIAPAIDAAKASDAAALNVPASPLLFGNRQVIIERAAALRLPAMYQWPEVAEQGGFVGYGPRLVQLTRDTMTRQLVKLLRGAKRADLPIEQPTKFELVINLQTAKAIGHEVPAALVLRADKIIE